MVKISPTLATIRGIVILLAYLIEKKKSAAKNINKGIIVKTAGYISHAAAISPLNKKAIDRCRPQPGQSRPKILFEKQGSI